LIYFNYLTCVDIRTAEYRRKVEFFVMQILFEERRKE